MLTPYAPHISEELWEALGNKNSVLDASFPVYEEKYTKEFWFLTLRLHASGWQTIKVHSNIPIIVG